MMEIECKIMNMTVSELFDKARGCGIKVEVSGESHIFDEYWKSNKTDKVIRFRQENPFQIFESVLDLTVKGVEENCGGHASERSETILDLGIQNASRRSVTDFLAALGYHLCHKIDKRRTKINYSGNIFRIHHDSISTGCKMLEWVEIEADSVAELHDIVFKLLGNGGNDQDRVTNLSTLDILRDNLLIVD